MKYYKIINEEGLYSTGGCDPRFTKRGKVWSSLRYVKSHFRNLDEQPSKVYNKCYLEVFDEDNMTKTSEDMKNIIEIF